jgi:hypothetical protein
VDLLVKNGENVGGRIARLQLGCEGMCNQVVLCALLVFIQGIIDEELEVRGSGSVSMGHEALKGRANSLFVEERMMGWFCGR